MPTVEPQLSDLGYSTTSALTPGSTHSRRRSSVDSDRLREARDTDSCNEEIPRPNSAFLEVGLSGEDTIVDSKLSSRDSRPKLQVRFRSKVEILEPGAVDCSATPPADNPPRPQMSPYFPTLPRLLFLALVIVLVAPSLHSSSLLIARANPLGRRDGSSRTVESLQGIKREALPEKSKRQNTQTDVCKRWSGQSAVVNGTMYYYSGRATSTSSQATDEWSMSHFHTN